MLPLSLNKNNVKRYCKFPCYKNEKQPFAKSIMVHILCSDGWLLSKSSTDKIWRLIVNNKQWSSSLIFYLLLKLITFQWDHSIVCACVSVCDFGFNFSFVSVLECQYKIIKQIAIAHIHYAFIILAFVLAFVFVAASFKHREKKTAVVILCNY